LLCVIQTRTAKHKAAKTLKLSKLTWEEVPLKDASAELELFMEKNNVDIALVQEPYYVNNKVTGLRSEIRRIQGTHIEVPKTAILLRNKSVSPIKLTSISSSIITAIKIQLESRQLVLISAYFTPMTNLDDFNANEFAPQVF
jgi:hypothetical protein